MKIVIPTAEGKLAQHFGHCQQFAMFTVDEATKSIAERKFLTPPPHEPGLLPRWLGEQNATVIIAGGMGAMAINLFNNSGITVITGAPAEPVEDLVFAYLDGTLQSGANVCDH